MVKLNIGRTGQNAAWIIGCKIVQSIINLIITMISARYLGPSNYGLISYAASVVAFFVPIMQLGFSRTLVQELINNPKEEGKIIGSAVALNFTSAAACMVMIFLFFRFAHADEQITIIVGILYSISLLFQATEIIQYWFQAKLLSKYYSITSLISYCLVSVYKIYLLVTAKDVRWFALSNSLDFLLISIILICIYYKLGNQKLSFSVSLSKEMFNRSKYYIISSMMVTIFSQTDRIMLKLLVDQSENGYYSAAFVCVNMTSFVFLAIIDSMRPVILAEKKAESNKYGIRLSQLYSIITYIGLAQSIFMTLFAAPIVLILFGTEYTASIVTLRIAVWFVTFSYYGNVRNVWILAEQKQKYLWIINMSGAIINILLNVIFIPISGAAGAAMASVLTQIFTNIILTLIIKPIKDCNAYLIKGLNPKKFTALLRSLIQKSN